MPAEPPNPWDLLHDDAKSYITLSTALLGVSATFAGNLLSDDDAARWLVFGGWTILVGSILCSIYASGQIFKNLKLPASVNYNASSGFLNASVILLTVGAAALALGAWRTSEVHAPSASPPMLARSIVADMSGVPEDALVVQSLRTTADGTSVLQVEVPSQGDRRYLVTVDDAAHMVTSAVPTGRGTPRRGHQR